MSETTDELPPLTLARFKEIAAALECRRLLASTPEEKAERLGELLDWLALGAVEFPEVGEIVERHTR